MITFITATILWTLLGNPCILPAVGCYYQNTIWIAEDTSPLAKEYVVYHEIGHSLGIMNEEIATKFSNYVLSFKYPQWKESFLYGVGKNDFDKTCPQECIKEILLINIK